MGPLGPSLSPSPGQGTVRPEAGQCAQEGRKKRNAGGMTGSTPIPATMWSNLFLIATRLIMESLSQFTAE